MSDLTGIHLVITRPRAQSERWAHELINLGANVDLAPMLEIVPVQEDAQVRAIKNCILDFDLYQKVIFVSQNAVVNGFEWLDNYWPQLPIRVDFFAVGEATAKLLQSYGASVTDLAQAQNGAMTSEALLQSPALQQVSGERILIMRGLGGRGHLGEELEARGARVEYCELYQRHLPLEAACQLERALCESEVSESLRANTVVVLQSGEALTHFISVLRQIFERAEQYENIALLVPSARVAEQAVHIGFTKVYVAANATELAMQQRIKEIRDAWIL